LKWGLSQADDYGGPAGDGTLARVKEWLRSFFPE